MGSQKADRVQPVLFIPRVRFLCGLPVVYCETMWSCQRLSGDLVEKEAGKWNAVVDGAALIRSRETPLTLHRLASSDSNLPCH